MRALPDWFGIESAVLDYVERSKSLPTYTAVVDGRVVGICLVKHHTKNASEIDLIIVEPTLHRRGIGAALLTAVEDDLIADGIEFLQAKTLGPSDPSPEYAATRHFYEALGFRALEEIEGLWPGNPCLILIKYLPRPE